MSHFENRICVEALGTDLKILTKANIIRMIYTFLVRG